MSEIKKSMLKITTLEEITRKNTPVHQLHPAVKLITTVIYLVTVISFASDQISGLLPYVFYPVLFMTIGEIPFKPLAERLLIALPFTLVAGLSNMFVSQDVVYYIGAIGITKGFLVLVSILIKTILTVTAVLILIATTKIDELLYVMVQFRIPSILILQITMTFRYLVVLLEEVMVMYHAYILRSPKAKGIQLKDMGNFLGQLIIRSFERAERIYFAMKCRGFEGTIRFSGHRKVSVAGWCYLVIVSSLMLIMRFFNLSYMIGGLFS